jgi:hypothetical protein
MKWKGVASDAEVALASGTGAAVLAETFKGGRLDISAEHIFRHPSDRACFEDEFELASGAAMYQIVILRKLDQKIGIESRDFIRREGEIIKWTHDLGC